MSADGYRAHRKPTATTTPATTPVLTFYEATFVSGRLSSVRHSLESGPDSGPTA